MARRPGWVGVVWMVALALGAAGAGEALLTPDGIQLSMGAAGDLTLRYPSILDKDNKSLAKFVAAEVSDGGARANVEYEGGLTVRFERQKAGLLRMAFGNPPAGFAKYRFEMNLPLASFAGVGTFKAGAADPVTFPGQKPEKPFLYQGHALSWEFAPSSGDAVRFTKWPDGSWAQLQDNRAWNTQNFLWFVICPRNADHAFVPLDFGSDPDAPATPLAAGPPAVVDRFGQDFAKDFPGKIRDESELLADARNEAGYYAGFAALTRDRFGGLPGSGEALGLEKTGFFHVENKDGRWHLVDPDGNLFYHLALCGFQPTDDYTYVLERPAGYFEWLPPPSDPVFATAWFARDSWWADKAFSFYLANVIRKYGVPYEADAWTRRMAERARAMGFTSAGAFTTIRPAFKDMSVPYTDFLPPAGPDLPGARGFWDPFAPDAAENLDRKFAAKAAPAADDPLLIGYYLANEQGAEDLPRALPALPGKFAAKQAFVAFLEERHGDVAKFNAAWNRADAAFADLAEVALAAGTRAAHEDVALFVERFLDRYYRLIRDAFRKHDANHLLLGSRWQPGTANNEALVRACARYNDVISLNYYTTGFDKTYVDRLHAWADGKPFLFSEWHYTSPPTSGLPGGLGTMATQEDRGRAYRHYVEQSASWGYVVGSEWFLLLDQARGGRFFEKTRGEKANTGFFSVADRPYRALCDAAFETHRRIFDVALGRTPPYVFDDPRFVAARGAARVVNAPRIAPPPVLDGSADGWPGVPPERIGRPQHAAGAPSDALSAAFRLAWDDRNLYFFADVADPTPRRNAADLPEALWNGDGVELLVGTEEMDQPGGLRFGDRQILLGAGTGEGQVYVRNRPADAGAPVRLAVADKPDGSGYLLEAAIPFSALGIAKPEAGRTLLFDLALDDAEDVHRVRQLVWNGSEKSSNDRSLWGRLTLVE